VRKELKMANWILLGLLMLIPGLLKLFVMKPSAITGMLDGLGFPAAAFFAWVLIIAEIGTGIAILAKWQLKTVVYIPAIILLVAAFTANWGSWPSFIIHLVVVGNYLLLGLDDSSN
jgi:uncharacterized membrane protein YphA (DoxX/SURF4 family)